MLDKIEWPSGIKYSHAWCAANSLDQIWEILGEEYKKDNVYYAILQFEEGVRRRKKNTEKPIAYTDLGSGDELCEEYTERLGSVDEKSRDYTELYFL